MSQSLVKQGHRQAKKLLFIQAVLLVFIASWGLLREFKVAVALLSGGLAVFIANSFFVFKAFSKSGAQQSKKVMGAFYFGEMAKFFLAGGLLVVGFLLLPNFEIYVLMGYIAALSSQWLAPAIIKTH